MGLQQTVTISGADWTREGMTKLWAEQESPAVAAECVESQIAWYVLNVRQILPGWSWTDAGFTGELRLDAIERLGEIESAAIDYVIEHLDEIRAEVAATSAA